MNIQHELKATENALSRQDIALRHGEPVELHAARAGRLEVAGALVWLTRVGSPDDLFLAPGDRIELARGERVVVEPWQAGSRAQLRWAGQPARTPGGQRRAWLDAARALFQRAPQRSV